MEVIEYVRREFKCDVCDARGRAGTRRPAAVPKTYVFNRVVALDCLEVPWNGKKYWFLRGVDHGTNYQVLAFLGERPTSRSVRRAFVQCWVKTLGALDIIITDPGTEFDGEFQRGVGQLGACGTRSIRGARFRTDAASGTAVSRRKP